MITQKAIQHFHYKLSNVWNATEKDIQAFESIRDFVVDKNKTQFSKYKPFAKLYVYVYAQYLKHYNATVFDEIPQKEFHKLLDRPFEAFVKAFVRQLNESELYELLESKEVIFKHPATISKEQREKEKEILNNLTKKEIDTILNPMWTYEDVEPNLVIMINSALNEL